jgi:polyisoprenoid-binding protein YceI
MFSKLTLRPVYFVCFLMALLLVACGGTSAPAATPTQVEEPAATPEPVKDPTATAMPAEEQAASTSTVEADAGSGEIGGLRTYVITPGESTASYIAAEEFFGGALDKYGIQAGLVDTIGSTQDVEGELQLNLNDLSSPLGTNQFTVNLASLTSDQPLRDRWIRNNGPEFERFPVAEFTATAIEDAPGTYTEGDEVQFKLVGDLTAREVTQPATFDVTARLEGDKITGVATAQLRMTDFGFDPPNFANTLTVADEVEVKVEFVAQEQ